MHFSVRIKTLLKNNAFQKEENDSYAIKNKINYRSLRQLIFPVMFGTCRPSFGLAIYLRRVSTY